jgi:hypothetical protein
MHQQNMIWTWKDSGDADACWARRYRGRRSIPESESCPVREGITPSSSTSLASTPRGVEDASARGPDLGLEPGGGSVLRSDGGRVAAVLEEGRARLSPTGGFSPRLQVLSPTESSVPSSLRSKADSMVAASAGASGAASFTLKRIADEGNNNPADMYSRSLAADTGPVNVPAALKY